MSQAVTVTARTRKAGADLHQGQAVRAGQIWTFQPSREYVTGRRGGRLVEAIEAAEELNHRAGAGVQRSVELTIPNGLGAPAHEISSRLTPR